MNAKRQGPAHTQPLTFSSPPAPCMRRRKDQAGGTLVGLIIGLLVGLAVALVVALYVSKVPVPFVDKLPQRTADQDAAEAERNKNWNPNAPLAGKAGVPPSAGSDADAQTAAQAASGASAPTAAAGIPLPPGTVPAAAARPPALDPRPEVTGLFIQAGAFGKPEDAEQQRARLAMLGFSARISERDQGGRLVYRVPWALTKPARRLRAPWTVCKPPASRSASCG